MEHIVLPTMNLVRKFDLQWDRSEIIPHDNALIDRLFEAGFELAESSGGLLHQHRPGHPIQPG
jgi:hypothetical protein